MRLILLLLTLPLVLTSPAQPLGSMQSLCPAQHSRKYVDISSATIEKSSTFQYSLDLFDSPITITRNHSEVIFSGNFSRLTLKNYALKREFVYFGKEMILKIPADHVFSMQKIPDIEIQIVHEAAEISKANSFRYVLFSQLYMVSKFITKIQTELSRYFHQQVKNGDLVQTSKIVKIIDGFPMLMYKGSAQSFPCRTDLLCLLKREYQLISQEDFQEVRSLLFEDGKLLPKTKSVKRRSLYEIQQISRKAPPQEEEL